MMLQRVLSSAALILALILILSLFGLAGGVLLLAVVSGLAFWEAARMLEAAGYRTLKKPGCGLAVATPPVYFLLPPATGHAEWALIWFSIALIMILIWTLAREKPASVLPVFAVTVLLFAAIPWLLGAYVLLGLAAEASPMAPDGSGLMLVIWLVAVAKLSDVGGLLVGCRIGRTPLAPSISPHKTFEGALGGVFASVVAGIFLFVLFRHLFPYAMGVGYAFLVALLTGCLAILSDLLESCLKRFTRIKDSGRMIPGIGGALDLVDSLVLTAPVGYALLVCLL